MIKALLASPSSRFWKDEKALSSLGTPGGPLPAPTAQLQLANLLHLLKLVSRLSP